MADKLLYSKDYDTEPDGILIEGCQRNRKTRSGVLADRGFDGFLFGMLRPRYCRTTLNHGDFESGHSIVAFAILSHTPRPEDNV